MVKFGKNWNGEWISEQKEVFRQLKILPPPIQLVLPSGPYWIDDPAATLGYDLADYWASCMIPLTGGSV